MLRDYWPDYLKDIVELKELASTEQLEIYTITDLINNMSRDFSAFTLTEYGIKRWEKILGVDGKSADDMDSRRFRVISRILEQIPITKRTLYSQLETLCGADGFTMEINGAAYMLTIKLALTKKSAFEDAKALVNRSAPANLICEVIIMYNQHESLRRFTHAQLAAMTHDGIRNEVI